VPAKDNENVAAARKKTIARRARPAQLLLMAVVGQITSPSMVVAVIVASGY
jgi:hypothetical protein